MGETRRERNMLSNAVKLLLVTFVVCAYASRRRGHCDCDCMMSSSIQDCEDNVHQDTTTAYRACVMLQTVSHCVPSRCCGNSRARSMVSNAAAKYNILRQQNAWPQQCRIECGGQDHHTIAILKRFTQKIQFNLAFPTEYAKYKSAVECAYLSTINPTFCTATKGTPNTYAPIEGIAISSAVAARRGTLSVKTTFRLYDIPGWENMEATIRARVNVVNMNAAIKAQDTKLGTNDAASVTVNTISPATLQLGGVGALAPSFITFAVALILSTFW